MLRKNVPGGREQLYFLARLGNQWVDLAEGDRLRGTDCYEPSAPSNSALIYPLMRVADGLH